MGGGLDGMPRQSRIFSMASGGWISQRKIPGHPLPIFLNQIVGVHASSCPLAGFLYAAKRRDVKSRARSIDSAMNECL
jgi:hypothetical protein